MIALSGKSGSGKSTVAAALVQFGYQRIGFADALKEEVYEKFGLRKTDPGGLAKLIEYGDGCRAVDPFHWVRRFADKAHMAQVCGLQVVCDDLRFRQEWMYLKAHGYLLVRVVAPEWLREARLVQAGMDPAFLTSQNPGETELNDEWPWHQKVMNDASTAPGQVAFDLVSLLGVKAQQKKGEPPAGQLSLF